MTSRHINTSKKDQDMSTLTVTSSEFSPSAFDRHRDIDGDILMVRTNVTIKNGIAAVPPTCLDFDESQSIEVDSSAWYNLQAAVRDASEILGSLDECNPPTIDDRFRLNVALDRIRKGADALEVHIARSGLWMSKDEWEDCDSRNTWHWF
jgi:hypothetical protein